MFRRITAACSTVVLLALSCAMAQAAPTPSSGTLSPLTPALAFADGPFTGANPSNQVPGSVGPDCGAVSNTCSDYALTVSIPPGYTALHPNDVVTIKVQWPTATVNDFDVYILDPSGTSVAHPGSATSADPEIASFHIADGTTSYKVRIGVFQAANESYTATVTLGPASQNVPILAHSYSLGTDVWTCNKHLDATNPTGPPPAVDHNLDGEPLTAFDGNGRLYISALAGVPVGCGVWYTDDACAQATTFVGAPDDGVGGGDAEIRTAPEKNPLGHYNVYTSSLSLANITTAVSFDGGNTFVATPLSSYTPVVDRNWNATYGSSICYLSFVNGATQPGNLLEVVRMDYTGMAAPVIAPASVVWDPLSVDPNQPHQKGNIVVDQRPGANTALLTAGPNGQGNVYTCWNESGQRVYCSVSTNFATTWTHHLVWDGGVGASYDHIFTWMAVDKAGNLYIVFSDDRNVYLCTSTDKGVTWTTPVRVNRGAGASNSCIFPQVVAGSVGHIAVCFYGASTTSPADPASNWQVYIARSDNALLQQPDFVEVKVNDDDFHTGAVCEAGFNCSSGRELCDNFDLDVNPVDGGLALAYGVFGVSGTFIARQLSGAGLFTDKTLADRSAGCPNPVNGCTVQAITGSPCIAPGFVTVVADPPGSTDLPPVAQPSEDILSVGVGEPDGVGNALEFSIKVASLDPANLPPNTFWRAIWVGPGGQRYVDVVNCATTAGVDQAAPHELSLAISGANPHSNPDREEQGRQSRARNDAHRGQCGLPHDRRHLPGAGFRGVRAQRCDEFGPVRRGRQRLLHAAHRELPHQRRRPPRHPVARLHGHEPRHRYPRDRRHGDGHPRMDQRSRRPGRPPGSGCHGHTDGDAQRARQLRAAGGRFAHVPRDRSGPAERSLRDHGRRGPGGAARAVPRDLRRQPLPRRNHPRLHASEAGGRAAGGVQRGGPTSADVVRRSARGGSLLGAVHDRRRYQARGGRLLRGAQCRGGKADGGRHGAAVAVA